MYTILANEHVIQVDKSYVLLSTAKKNNISGTESNDSLVMIIGVVAGVLGNVAIGLIVGVIIISQSRRSSRKEEILVVSDDS